MQRTQNYNLVKIDLTDSPPDITVLNGNFDTIDTTLLNKVDKAEGKQLSTNDYTTEEKNKLSEIADNANNYVHPESHPATIITEDETHRFLTDVERNKLNGIAESANNYVHPPTHTASEITEEENKRFLTDAERTKLSGIQDGANNYTHPPTHEASMIVKTDGQNIQDFFDNGGTFNGTVTFKTTTPTNTEVSITGRTISAKGEALALKGDGTKDLYFYHDAYWNIDAIIPGDDRAWNLGTSDRKFNDAHIGGNLSVGGNITIGGTNIMETGEDGESQWIRFYNGIQIAYGTRIHANSETAMNNQPAGNVFGGHNATINFPVAFANTPAVTLSVDTSGYSDCQASGVSPISFTAKMWANYQTPVRHIHYRWIAVGKWK